MLQLLQHQSTGTISVEELPEPHCPEGFVLVRVSRSLISAGTERTSVSKAQSSLIERAMKQPQEVKKVLESVRKDGFFSTLNKVQNTLDSYKALGYSAAGTVIESRAEGFLPGDRVACGGNMYAYHAHIISVPKHLTALVPATVPFDEAAYTTLGAIAMQGVRQAAPSLGETVLVMGLGLLGQLTVQLLAASGCTVIGMDVNDSLFDTARRLGASETFLSNKTALPLVQALTKGLGVDAVIITAATDSNEPVELAMECVRKRGRVVIVGAVGMNLPRSPFYEKEVEFTISCSYGAGRYDPQYEEAGHDYPAPYVRWTEQRNMQSFLDLLATGRINTRAMTTHTFSLHDAPKAYDLITGKVQEPYSGILLSYPTAETDTTQSNFKGSLTLIRNAKLRTQTVQERDIAVGFVGAGAFAQSNILPYLKADAHISLQAVCTSSPVKAKSVAERFGFREFGTDARAVITSNNTNAIFCASRHDSHGNYVVEALRADKHIFVEKPLCISLEELLLIDEARAKSQAQVMVGFNRRFSAPFCAIKKFFATRQDPMSMLYRVNAGAIPLEHWIQDPSQGGRIVGEVCHFVDCMMFLTDAVPVRVFAESISSPNVKTHQQDTVIISLKFSDGSIGSIQYFANGDNAVAKEYCEVFADVKTAQLHNFESVDFSEGRTTKRVKYDGSKGHKEEIAATLAAMRFPNTPFPIEYSMIRAATATTFAIQESLRTGESVHVTHAN